MSVSFNDLLELEQEFVDCLFSYYQCILLENDTHQDWVEPSEHKKRIMIAELAPTQRIVLKERMRTNDLALNETYQFHQELFGNGILNPPVLPAQLLMLWEQVETLKTDFEQFNKKVQKDRYREILQTYMNIDQYICTGFNITIKRRIQGLQAIQVRYDKKLYPKREVLYQVLRDSAKKYGRWANLHQAVSSSMDEIKTAFLEFEHHWLNNEIHAKQEHMDKLSKEYNSSIIGQDKEVVLRQKRKYKNRIKTLETETKQLAAILNSKNSIEHLDYQTPYNTLYDKESMIHHLRGCQDLLDEFLL